jgi:hypothetical protein
MLLLIDLPLEVLEYHCKCVKDCNDNNNIPIVNMYLAVVLTQRALIDPQFAASSQGMHGQTPLLKSGAQRCNRPGERTF